jgi:hypothetical protein
MRTRLIAGLKRYFFAKRLAGLLSVDGLRILDYACDKAADASAHPLRIWAALEREVRGGWGTHAASRATLLAARAYRALPAWGQRAAAAPFRHFTGLLRRYLGRRMLVACEVAVEYYLSLLWSPQIQFLKGHADSCWRLLGEVDAEGDEAHTFIIERGEGRRAAAWRGVALRFPLRCAGGGRRLGRCRPPPGSAPCAAARTRLCLCSCG